MITGRSLPNEGGGDSHILRLAALFADDPVWRDAMAHLRQGVTGALYFSHRPGEVWHFVQTEEGVQVQPGAAKRPDFAFCFTPASVDQLAAVDGDIGDVAVTLFDLILSEDSNRRVGFRVLAPFWRLVRNGHVRLLLDGGPSVLSYGAAHGVGNVGQLRAFVATLRADDAAAVAPTSDGCC